MSRARALLVPWVLLLACQQSDGDTERARSGPLSVGDRAIDSELVGQVSQAANEPLALAARAIARDMSLAQALADSEPDLASYLRTLALARTLSRHFIERARAAGPATEEELAMFTARHWWELDRPMTSRTTHVVLRVTDPEDRPGARVVAERLQRELLGASSREEFRRRAEAADSAGFELEVEDLLPVTPDGRAADPERPPKPGARVTGYDEAYARAANEIAEVGEQSGVIESVFGFHILLLTERLPEQRTGPEERRGTLRNEIESARAHDAERDTVARVRAEVTIDVDLAALAHTEGLFGVH